MSEDIEKIKQQAINNYNRKRFEDAIQGFQVCLDHHKSEGNELDVAEALNNLSVTHLAMKQAQLALEEVQGTAEVFAGHGDRKREGMAIANTAAALEELGRGEEALGLYEQVLVIFKEVGEKSMRASILRRISNLQMRSKQSLQALASMEAAYSQEDKPSLKDSFFNRILAFLRKKITG